MQSLNPSIVHRSQRFAKPGIHLCCVDQGRRCLESQLSEGIGVQRTTFLALQSHKTTLGLGASDGMQPTYLHATQAPFELIYVRRCRKQRKYQGGKQLP